MSDLEYFRDVADLTRKTSCRERAYYEALLCPRYEL